MASVEQDMVNELVKQITRLSTNVTDKIAATIMYSGRVKQVLSDNTYLIQYSDEERNFKLKHKTLSIGDEVHVVYPQGSIKDRFLLEDISSSGTGSGGSSSGAVSSVNGKTGAVTLGYTDVGASASGHTHSAVTTSVDGFMSAADKTKLDGIATNANNYVHPSYTAFDSGLYKITVDSTGHISKVTAVSKSDITALGIPAQDTNTIYVVATQTSDGLMSSVDKTKLDSIASGAQANTITGVKGDAEADYRVGNVNISKANIGLGNVDNTADTAKPVSTAQQSAVDTAYSNANAYTDTKISQLINGAPDTLDTLKEISDAMAKDESVVTALSESVGKKANQTELDTHTGNSTIHISASERTNWNTAYTESQNSHVNGVKGDSETSYRSGNVNITKGNIGLGNVPDVATNDQTVTYDDTTTLATLSTGEKISAAFAKIKLAITTLINHIANTSNPHSVTASQVGLGNVANVLQYSASNQPPYPVTSVNGSTGAVTITNITGNAATATTATSATNDSAGNNINTTYIKSLSVSGTTVTYTKGDGTTGTITTQDTDTNTTYSAGTGLALSGTTINHSNSITAGTASGDATKTLTFGGTFTIPSITYNAQGHITAKSSTTMTMPATPTTITGNAGSATKLATARTIAISGGATGTATSFNGSANISIPVTSLDATKLTGTATIGTTGNAATATNATNDINGNPITTTYAKQATTYTKAEVDTMIDHSGEYDVIVSGSEPVSKIKDGLLWLDDGSEANFESKAEYVSTTAPAKLTDNPTWICAV